MQTELSSNPNLSKSATSQWYSWVVIILSSCFLFYKYILQVYPSVMTNELMRAFHVHGAGLGNLAATFFYTYLITQLFVGVLLDRFSPRLLTTLAILVAGVGGLLFSQVHELPLALLARALMGVGAAFATVSYMKFAAIYFRPQQFAFVSGLLATAAMVGAIAGEAPLAFFIGEFGWRQSLFGCGILGIVIAVVFYLFVADRNTSETKKASTERLTFKDVLEVLSKPQNWLLTFYSGLAFAPVAVFGGLWGPPFVEEAYHLNRTQAASLVSLIFFGLAVGGPLLGWLSDRLGKRRAVMFSGSLLSLLSILLVIYWDQMPIILLGLLLFLFGLGTGAFMLGFVIGKETNKILVAATVIAMINTGDAIFGAVTEPFIGKLLDLGWQGIKLHGAYFYTVATYHRAFVVLPIYLLCALILVKFIREHRAIPAK